MLSLKSKAMALQRKGPLVISLKMLLSQKCLLIRGKYCVLIIFTFRFLIVSVMSDILMYLLRLIEVTIAKIMLNSRLYKWTSDIVTVSVITFNGI